MKGMRIYDSPGRFLEENTLGAVYLYDCDENRVLAARNEHTRMPVASLTKIATAMTILESVPDPSRAMVRVREESVEETIRLEGKLAGFQDRIGESFSVLDCLYPFLVSSGCDAGLVLADDLSGGDRAAFMERINACAERTGCRNTHFRDPNGLLDEGVSTAFDIFLLFRRMLENPLLRRITATERWTVPGLAEPVLQTNCLKRFDSPFFFPYTCGSKTGTTDLAGRCLACSFRRRGHTWIAVVLGRPFIPGEEGIRDFYDDIVTSLLLSAYVREAPFMRLTAEDHLIRAGVGEEITLRPRILFSNAREEPVYRYVSLNPEVAEADENGHIRVLDRGIAQIGITVQTGDYDLVCVNACGGDRIRVERREMR